MIENHQKHTTEFVELNGSKFYVRCFGEGEPIVFLHGGPGSEHRFFLPHVYPWQTHSSWFCMTNEGAVDRKHPRIKRIL
ncbi:hypothetical protein [Pseudalkalibacillus sp. SCS-8]|uniref:hypothetical protein n=1 Tax=Pseudalkalibacillus nanhaiensis TaxID=3115291 RepID=UPI0032DB522E